MAKIIAFVIGLIPVGLFLFRASQGEYAPDPGQILIINFAHTATIYLLITLALKPLSTLPKLKQANKFSRMMGLYCFFYALLHVFAYLAFKTGFMWDLFREDLVKRPYVYVGMAAFLILAAMALTSTRWWQRRLKRNWKNLHRLVYLALILIVIHILWVARSDILWTVVYGAVGASLLVWRIYNHWVAKK